MALLLNGSNQYLSLSSNAACNFTGNFTASVWVKFASTPTGANDSAIITKGNDSGGTNNVGWFLGVNFNSIKAFCYQASSGSYYGVGYDTTFPLDTWIHIAAGYSAGAWQIFYNGVSVASSAQPVGAVATGAPLAIGASIYANTLSAIELLSGTVDDVAVWSNALSAAEIAALASGARPWRIRRDIMAGYWFMDGVTGAAPDYSGNGNPMLWTGTPSVVPGAALRPLMRRSASYNTGLTATTVTTPAWSPSPGPAARLPSRPSLVTSAWQPRAYTNPAPPPMTWPVPADPTRPGRRAYDSVSPWVPLSLLNPAPPPAAFSPSPDPRRTQPPLVPPGSSFNQRFYQNPLPPPVCWNPNAEPVRTVGRIWLYAPSRPLSPGGDTRIAWERPSDPRRPSARPAETATAWTPKAYVNPVPTPASFVGAASGDPLRLGRFRAYVLPWQPLAAAAARTPPFIGRMAHDPARRAAYWPRPHIGWAPYVPPVVPGTGGISFTAPAATVSMLAAVSIPLGVITPTGLQLLWNPTNRRLALGPGRALLASNGQIVPVIPSETLTLNTPVGAIAGQALELSGTYANGAPFGLDVSLDSGRSWSSVTNFLTLGGSSGGGWVGLGPTPSAASSLSLLVRDQYLPIVTATSQAFPVLAAPGGGGGGGTPAPTGTGTNGLPRSNSFLGLDVGDTADTRWAARYAEHVAAMGQTPAYQAATVVYTTPTWTDAAANSAAQAAAWKALPAAANLIPVLSLPMALAGAYGQDRASLFATITSGACDTAIAGIVTAWRDAPEGGFSQIFVVVGPDANGNGRAWHADGAGEPVLYVSAFRHIAALMRSVAGIDCRIVWSMAATPYTAQASDALYPGDDVVDVISIGQYSSVNPVSLYDWGTGATDASLAAWSASVVNREAFWSYPSAINAASAFGYTPGLINVGFGFTHAAWLARSRGKPLAVTAGAGFDDGDFPYWLERVVFPLGGTAPVKGAPGFTQPPVQFVVVRDVADASGDWDFKSDAGDPAAGVAKPLAAAAWKAAFASVPVPSPSIAYTPPAAPLPETLTVLTPVSATVGVPVQLVGTYVNVTPGGVQYSSNNGTTWTNATGFSAAGGTWSATGPMPGAAGLLTLLIRDTAHPAVTASTGSFSVAAANGTGGGASFGPLSLSAPASVTGASDATLLLGLIPETANRRVFFTPDGTAVYLAGSYTWNDFQDLDAPGQYDIWGVAHWGDGGVWAPVGAVASVLVIGVWNVDSWDDTSVYAP